MNKDTYIEKNRGYITASKCKEFVKNPESFKLRYIDEIPSPAKEKKAFKIGTALDDYFSIGGEKFFEKYRIDIGSKWSDFIPELQKLDKYAGMDEKEIRKYVKTLAEAREELLGDTEDKIKLSKGEWETIEGMIKELHRQKLADIKGDYIHQQEIIVEYKNIKLKGTLDRLSLEKKLIRDYKTTNELSQIISNNFTKFHWNLETMTDPFQYRFQMIFYYLLVKLKFGIACDVILDVVGNTFPYPYQAIKYTADTMEKDVAVIIDILDQISESVKTGKYIRELEEEERVLSFNNDYYSQMHSTIQKDFIIIT